MQQLIAIDIGGTQIKYGIVTLNGEIISQGQMDTDAHLGAQNMLRRVGELANRLKIEHDVQGLAVSTAGQVNSDEGSIIFASSAIPHYQGCQVKAYLQHTTGLITEVDNDVNCAMLGECWLGAGKNMQNGLMMTVGTGIGGGILLDGNLYRGHGFSAGEWGYMRVAGDDYQHLASTSALIRAVAKNCTIPLAELDGRKVFSLEQSNLQVAQTIAQYFEHLAEGLANLLFIFNPEKVILGGGIAVRDDFLSRVNSTLVKYVPEHVLANTKIVSATLGNNAGFCGAAYHFFTKHNVLMKQKC